MTEVELIRSALRRSNPAITYRQVQEIVERGLGGGRRKQFKLKGDVPKVIQPSSEGDSWIYRVRLAFEHIGRSSDQAQIERKFQEVKEAIIRTAPSKGGWMVVGTNGDVAKINKRPALVAMDEENVIAEINLEKGRHFDHLYGLDAQINVLLAALQTAKETKYTKRFHTVLYGKPGCGKSEILRGVKNMVGEEGVIEFDGTQTTAAGAISVLMDAEILPPLLIIEEIEKVPDAAFMWLLGALDGRAEIRKVTNWGVRQRRMPFVCAATVNDLPLFQSRHEGAMSSRFTHKLYCPRPSEEIIRRILRREVESIGGNREWIEHTIRFCFDVEKTTDPRRAIAVCLTGRDKLLDGSFQKNLMACHEQHEE